jgi:hypothetical protein
MMLLNKAIDRPLPKHPGFLLVENDRYEPSVFSLYERLDRGSPEGRLRLRFERGMRSYEFRRDGQTVATTWAVLRVERFIDEIGLGFPSGSGSLWMRDIFVVLQPRGLGFFAVLFDWVVARIPGRDIVWSAVERSNGASRRFLPTGKS